MPSITIALIPHTHPAADETQRFHSRGRVDVCDEEGAVTIHGAAEGPDLIELSPEGLRALLRRAYLAGLADGTRGGLDATASAVAQIDLDNLEAGYLALIEEDLGAVPVAGEAVDPDGSSAVLTLADLDEDEIVLGI